MCPKPRLKKIQDLALSDVDAALAKLPGDVSADCCALLRRIFSIPPAARPCLADIMADPWFRQFLPDLSKLAVAQPREQQGVAEITRILQDADRLSQLRVQQPDDFDSELMDDVLEDVMDEVGGGSSATDPAAAAAAHADAYRRGGPGA